MDYTVQFTICRATVHASARPPGRPRAFRGPSRATLLYPGDRSWVLILAEFREGRVSAIVTRDKASFYGASRAWRKPVPMVRLRRTLACLQPAAPATGPSSTRFLRVLADGISSAALQRFDCYRGEHIRTGIALPATRTPLACHTGNTRARQVFRARLQARKTQRTVMQSSRKQPSVLIAAQASCPAAT